MDELFTAREWRGVGVARWLMWHAAEGRRVELQVLSGVEGADARRAYTGMGLHRMTGKETSRTYREVSDKSRYEFWVTNEYVVQSGWDERTALRVVDGDWGRLKDEYGDEMIRLLMEAHGYTAREAEQSLAGGERGEEEGSVIVVVEHGERTRQPQPVPAVAEQPESRRGSGGAGEGAGGREALAAAGQGCVSSETLHHGTGRGPLL